MQAVKRITDIETEAPPAVAIEVPSHVVPFVRRPRTAGGYERWGKRAFDLIVGSIALVAATPLLVAVAAALLLSDGRPVFFVSRRVGAAGAEFGVIKFRTMRRDAEAALQRVLAASPEARREFAEKQKLTNDPRVTRLGAFLRATSLDELPQIFNVLRGEMSLIGPRPVPKAEMHERYGRYAAHVLAVRPGMTGMWQVSGRSDVSYDERVLLDAQYSRDVGLLLDLRILAQTIPAVLLGRGAR